MTVLVLDVYALIFIIPINYSLANTQKFRFLKFYNNKLQKNIKNKPLRNRLQYDTQHYSVTITTNRPGNIDKGADNINVQVIEVSPSNSDFNFGIGSYLKYSLTTHKNLVH